MQSSLIIEQGFIGGIETFMLPMSKKLTREEVYRRLLSKGFSNPIWGEDHIECSQFMMVESFLFNRGIPKGALRTRLGGFKYRIGETDLTGSGSLFLMLYRELGIASLIVSLEIEDFTVDEAINMRHGFYASGKIIIEEHDIFTEELLEGEALDYPKMMSLAMQRVSFGFEGGRADKDKDLQSEYCGLVEIRSFKGLNASTLPDEDFFNRYSKLLYGLITQDEGWRFVPKALADQLIEGRWGSRDFLSIIPFSFGALMLNLKSTASHKSYLTFQNSLESNDQYKKDYFNADIQVACLDHGLYYALENANIMRLMIRRNLKSDAFYRKYSATRIIEDRKKLIETINLLTESNIGELDQLGAMINEKFQIGSYIETVKERLELAENDTIIRYEIKTNRFMTVLTVLGLFLAITEVWDIITRIWVHLMR